MIMAAKKKPASSGKKILSTTGEIPKGRRAVIIGGVRTPFVRAFGEFMLLDTIALGVLVRQELHHSLGDGQADGLGHQ